MASHQWHLTRMLAERHSNKGTHHNMETHDRRHQEANSGSHQETAAADAGTGEAIVLVEECGSRSRPSMGMAVRDAVLLRRNRVAGGRAAAATPNPDQGSTNDPPPRPKSRRAHGDTPAAQVWARPGLTEMASPASTETSRASLRRPATPNSQGIRTPPPPPPDSLRSLIEPRVLFSPGIDSSADEDEASSHGGGDESEEMAPGTTVEISVEGYTDDTYMLAMCAMMLMLMLQATGHWTTLTRQEINVKKSLALAVQHTPGEPGSPSMWS